MLYAVPSLLQEFFGSSLNSNVDNDVNIYDFDTVKGVLNVSSIVLFAYKRTATPSALVPIYV